MTKRLAVTLQPGDRYRDDKHDAVVTIVDGQEKVFATGRTGLFRYMAECDGRRGYVVFGQAGVVDVIEEGEVND